MISQKKNTLGIASSRGQVEPSAESNAARTLFACVWVSVARAATPPPNCRLNRPLHGFSKMRSALTDACGTPQGAQPASARNFCCGLKAAATCQQKIPRDNTRREEGEETSLNKRLMLPIMLATHRCKARGCKAETAVQHCGLRAKGKASSGHFAQYCCNGPPTRRPVLGAE